MRENVECSEDRVEEVKADDRKVIAHIVMNVYDDHTVKFELNGDMKMEDLAGFSSFGSSFGF